jgi:uncharacterized protein YndB with AHSA1/START domain
VSTTKVSRHLRAPRSRVYAALIDAAALPRWKVPREMTMQVHAFDGREGGSYRISLTYSSPDREGKTTAHTDTYTGRFVRLVPDEQVVEVQEFETADPALRGEMTSTITLTDADDGGTDLVAVHQGVPDAVRPEDNELGWRESLDRLAELVEDSDQEALDAFWGAP